MWTTGREDRRRVHGALVAAVASLTTAGAALGQAPSTGSAVEIGWGLEVRDATALDPAQAAWSAAPELDTRIEIRVTGLVARTRIEQRFRNPSPQRVEARYLFPLPEGAAIDLLEVDLGDRRIVGEVREKFAAQSDYAAARQSGRRAALLEARRPNVWSISIAGLDPGAEIEVQLEYQEFVRYDMGIFRLRVPLVVAARYEPVPSLPMAERASPVRPATAPQIVRPVSLHATIDAGVPLIGVESPTHALDAQRGGDHRWAVRLLDDPVPADRDLELVWRPERSQAPVLARFEEEVDGERFAALLLLPPAPELTAGRLARELVIVLDTSGSMQGASIAQARRAVRVALTRLAPGDRFNVIRFSSDAEALFEASVPADRSTIESADRLVAGLEAEGGTNMVPALELAFGDPGDGTTVRQLLFVTDGQVSNEEELFAVLSAGLGERRLFPVGIGSAPNSFLLTRAAELGRGSATFIGDLGEVETKMAGLFARLERPVLADLEVTWDDATAEIYPPRPGDLYVGEPLLLVARVDRPGAAVQIEGRLAEAPFVRHLPATQPAPMSGLSKLWARRRIDALEHERRRPDADRDRLRAEIVELAIQYGLATQHTSFLAVEHRSSAAPGDLPARDVPTMIPAGADGAGLPQGGTAAPLAWLVAGGLGLTGAALRHRRRPADSAA